MFYKLTCCNEPSIPTMFVQANSPEEAARQLNLLKNLSRETYYYFSFTEDDFMVVRLEAVQTVNCSADVFNVITSAGF